MHANENWSMHLKCVVLAKKSFVKFKILYPFSVLDGLCKLTNGYSMWTSPWRIKCSSCIFSWLQFLSYWLFTKTEMVCVMYPGRFLWSSLKIHDNCLLLFQGQSQIRREPFALATICLLTNHKACGWSKSVTFLLEPTTHPTAATFTIQFMRIMYCKFWYSGLFKKTEAELLQKRIRIEIQCVWWIIIFKA